MKTLFQKFTPAVLVLAFASVTLPATAQSLQLASPRAPSLKPPSGGNGDSCLPLLSADGRYVLFSSTANNLLLTSNNTVIPAPRAASFNVFLSDRTNANSTLLTVNADGSGGGNGDSFPSDLSTNCRYAAFESSASDLVAGDTNSAPDVFVRDLEAGTTLLVSVGTNGLVGNGASRSAAMTPDGRYVAFVSEACNLVPGDTNRIADVFVRDLQSGVTTLVSVGAMPSNSVYFTSSSEAPELTPDSRYVAFYSTATNLVPGVRSLREIYVRDLAAGTTCWASSYARTAVGSNNIASFSAALSADGRFVAYEAAGLNGSAGVVLRYSMESGLTDRALIATGRSWPARKP